MRDRKVIALGTLLAASLLTTATLAAVRTAWDASPTASRHDLAKSGAMGRWSGAGCRRWRTLAVRLGETYAGYRLRQVVATRLCALADDAGGQEIWGWPWRHYDMRADLPPQQLGRFGAWEIRCGEVGLRRRCALASETVMAAALDPETRPLRVVAHLVIDRVAGRESVLWRVHVSRDVGSLDTQGGILVEMAGRQSAEPFDACGRRGCMAEAAPRLSGEVASWLWMGRPMSISLGQSAAGAALGGVLPAHGFRRGLAELMRLRRQEARAVAGR